MLGCRIDVKDNSQNLHALYKEQSSCWRKKNIIHLCTHQVISAKILKGGEKMKDGKMKIEQRLQNMKKFYINVGEMIDKLPDTTKV